jgi:hypothetical protein
MAQDTPTQCMTQETPTRSMTQQHSLNLSLNISAIPIQNKGGTLQIQAHKRSANRSQAVIQYFHFTAQYFRHQSAT